jgi:hypothetical protein
MNTSSIYIVRVHQIGSFRQQVKTKTRNFLQTKLNQQMHRRSLPKLTRNQQRSQVRMISSRNVGFEHLVGEKKKKKKKKKKKIVQT